MKNNQTTNIVLNICASISAVLACVLGFTLTRTFAIVSAVICLVVCGAILIFNYVYKRKLIKMLEDQKQKQQKKAKQTSSLLDVYAVLGIPPQYKTDGTLKDVYELLCIKPQYTKDGKRQLTIYELLGINPKFTQSAIEVPYVLRIKNRVNSLVKLQQSTAPLIYFPRDKQIIGDKHIFEELKKAEGSAKEKPSITEAVVVKPPKAAQKTPTKEKPDTLNGRIREQKGSASTHFSKETKVFLSGKGDKVEMPEKKVDIKLTPSKDDKNKTATVFIPGEELIKKGKQVIQQVAGAIKEGVEAVVEPLTTVGAAFTPTKHKDKQESLTQVNAGFSSFDRNFNSNNSISSKKVSNLSLKRKNGVFAESAQQTGERELGNN